MPALEHFWLVGVDGDMRFFMHDCSYLFIFFSSTVVESFGHLFILLLFGIIYLIFIQQQQQQKNIISLMAFYQQINGW